MSIKVMLQQMIDYHVTATRKVWDVIEPLGDELFVREHDYSIGSIRNHMVHLTTHGVDHRSQVLPLVAAAGGHTFPHDFIMHVWGWPAPPQH